MKKKVNRREFSDLDKFDRKQHKHFSAKSKESKRKLSIYDEFSDEEDYLDYKFGAEEEEDEFED